MSGSEQSISERLFLLTPVLPVLGVPVNARYLSMQLIVLNKQADFCPMVPMEHSAERWDFKRLHRKIIAAVCIQCHASDYFSYAVEAGLRHQTRRNAVDRSRTINTPRIRVVEHIFHRCRCRKW